MRTPVIFTALLLAQAAAVAHATTWSCTLTPAATQIACTAVDEPAQDAAAATPAPATTTVRGTSFPLDPRRKWFIDLWSPATDQAGVEVLARASMCYRSPGCKVVWERR